MPIRHLDSRIGAICLNEKEGGREFTGEDEETMVWLVSQAAMAIANARRYLEERQAKASLQALVDTSPVGVAVLDPMTMGYTLVNEERLRIGRRLHEAGIDLEGIIRALTLNRPDGSELSLEDLPSVRAAATGETVRVKEMTIHFPEVPPITVLASAAPTSSEDGEITSVVSILQDMTPLEDLLRQRSEFLGMVARSCGRL